jgi:hypothetical protein
VSAPTPEPAASGTPGQAGAEAACECGHAAANHTPGAVFACSWCDCGEFKAAGAVRDPAQAAYEAFVPELDGIPWHQADDDVRERWKAAVQAALAAQEPHAAHLAGIRSPVVGLIGMWDGMRKVFAPSDSEWEDWRAALGRLIEELVSQLDAIEDAAQEPHAADGIEAAFASGMRVRTAPCTAGDHDSEHFQVRTNGHWVCGHLLASVLIAHGIFAAHPEPQPAPDPAEQVRLARADRDAVRGRMLALAAEFEAEAYRLVPLNGLPDQMPDVGDEIAHDALLVAARRVRQELDV